MSAVIFDFNGTIIFDGVLHDKAWNCFAMKHRGYKISHEEFVNFVYGFNIEVPISHLLGYQPDTSELAALEEDRESTYRSLCLEHAEELKHLAPGLIEFLNTLKKRCIPVNIATASPLVNMEFFFDLLDLDRWFSLEQIAYNDHSFPGKPEPDIFLRAASKLGVDPSECTMFEDSPSGLEAIRRAGASHSIAVASEFDHAMLAALPGVDLVINTYNDIQTLLELIERDRAIM